MSSDSESINEFTLDEIDLDKPLVDLYTLLDDRSSLTNALFEHLNKNEFIKIFGRLKNDERDNLDIEHLKELCLIQLERLPKRKIIKLLDLKLDGEKADISLSDEDLDEEEVKESVDDIQMNVDDQEYEDFLKSEFNNESNKKEEINKQTNQIKKSSPDDKSNKDKLSKKEQQNLINELAFPSVNENLDNCKQNPIKNEKGWMNLWNQTQLEIQELEMRANAIKTMMEKSKFKKENALQNSSNNQLLDNIDSEYDYVSDEDEKSELNCSNEVMTKDKKVDERISQSKSNKSEDEEKQINEIIEDEYLVIKVENPKHHKSHKNHKKKDKNSKKSNRSEDKANENRSEKSRQKISGESRTSKLEQLKKDENRVSVESGEIFDDEEDNEHIEKIIKNKNIDNLIKKTRSPSITSSIDSFGRNRRRRSYSSQESDQSFSSLDEILREAEEEQNLSKSDIKLKSQINKSNSKHHHKHHHKHQKSKKQRTPKSHSDEY